MPFDKSYTNSCFIELATILIFNTGMDIVFNNILLLLECESKLI